MWSYADVLEAMVLHHIPIRVDVYSSGTAGHGFRCEWSRYRPTLKSADRGGDAFGEGPSDALCHVTHFDWIRATETVFPDTADSTWRKCDRARSLSWDDIVSECRATLDSLRDDTPLPTIHYHDAR